MGTSSRTRRKDPGESAVVDVHLKRTAAKTLEFKADYFLPETTDQTELGDIYHRLKKIWINDFYLWNHLLAAQHNSFDLGSSSVMWRDLYLSGVLKALYQVACNLIPDTTDTRYLGNSDTRWIMHSSYLNCNTLNINGTEIVRSDRCLHDVEADASILTYGTLDVNRMPAAGWTGDVEAAKVGGGTRTLHFNHGVFTGYTDT